jgi:hypothetical protein
LLISSRSFNKHGHHRQFLFLIGWFLKNLLLWNRFPKLTETYQPTTIWSRPWQPLACIENTCKAHIWFRILLLNYCHFQCNRYLCIFACFEEKNNKLVYYRLQARDETLFSKWLKCGNVNVNYLWNNMKSWNL